MDGFPTLFNWRLEEDNKAKDEREKEQAKVDVAGGHFSGFLLTIPLSSSPPQPFK